MRCGREARSGKISQGQYFIFNMKRHEDPTKGFFNREML